MSPASGPDLLMVAGEASGDLHASRLLTALRERVPGLRAFGLGGDEMIAAGFEPLARSSEISVMGFTEVVRIYRRARQIFDEILTEVDRRGARGAVLIDFSGFNLRLAKQLARRGVRVVYYIGPQVWASRQRRVKTIARTISRMLVVLPFEVEFYRRHGIEAVHVGHPLVDEVPVLDQVWDRPRTAGEEPREPFVLTLLPGSRRGEVRALLPDMLETARRIAEALPLRVRLIQARSVAGEIFDDILTRFETAAEIAVERVTGADRFPAIAGSHLALCASGTATVEVGLLGTPMIVLYRVHAVTALVGRLLVRLPHFSLVNLILEAGVVPELAQDAVDPDRLAPMALELLRDSDKIAAMRGELGRLRSLLGESGASRRAADHVVECLELGAGREDAA